jgi:hypothetical protein
MSTLVAAFVIVLLAAATQAVTGFGSALVAAPLLAMTTDARTAIVATSLVSLMLTVGTTVRERAYVRWRTAGGLLAAAALGLPVGLLVLCTASERVLSVLLAVVVLGCTALVWLEVRLGAGPLVVAGVGLVSGFLTTATGMNGPPLVAAFRGMGFDPRTFRATLAAVFAVAGAVGTVGYGVAGQLDSHAIAVVVAGIPGLVLGWWAGNRAFARIDTTLFRRIVVYALVMTSLVTLAQMAAG